MTSQHSDRRTFEQKIQPVPSSDKMALDLDINGFTKHDETNVDTAPSEITLTPNDLPTDKVLIVTEVNGTDNLNAFSSNQSILAREAHVESQATEISPTSAPTSSSLFDTNTTNSEAQPAISPIEAHHEASGVLTAAIEQAVDNSIPHLVEHPESDLRGTNSHFESAESLPASLKESSDAVVESRSSLPLAPAEPVEDMTPEQPDYKIESTSWPNVHLDRSDTPIKTDEPASAPIFDIPATEEDTKQIMEDPMQIDSQPQGIPSLFGGNVNDTAMTDAPTAKIAREREDDDEIEPSAKRTKTEDLPAESPSMLNGDAAHARTHGAPISDFQAKEIIKVLKSMSRSAIGKNFRQPVAQLWPNFAERYSTMIANPIDLSTMAKKLEQNSYQSLDELKADAVLLHANAVTFNGADHEIAKGAGDVSRTILAKLDSIPTEPPTAAKKDKKAKRPVQAPSAAARTPASSAPRRQSKGSHGNPAPSVSASSETYALTPDGLPQLRRDSTKLDGGRPKREIHPPKNKDLAYHHARPKNKKFATELKFCEEVLNELTKTVKYPFAGPFQVPVDPVALGIPNYFAIVKKPMDLSTVNKKLKEGSYTHAADFEKDVRLMLNNCFKFNPPGNIVHSMGLQLQTLFNDKWAEKDQYLIDHAPAVASPASAAESEDEEEEEEEISDTQALNNVSAAKERLLVEQQKLIDLMNRRSGNSGEISMQQDLVNFLQQRVQTEEEAAKKKVVKKPKVPKPAKKAPPLKKVAAAPKKGKKDKYLGTLEKETISNGLGALPEDKTAMVLEWIQADQGNLSADPEGSFELDIDIISNDVLWRIYELVMKHAPEVEAGLRSSMLEHSSPRAARPPTKKKNKPMTKSEQERKLDQIKGTMESFKKANSQSQEPIMPTVEQRDPETSGDEDSDSEEE